MPIDTTTGFASEEELSKDPSLADRVILGRQKDYFSPETHVDIRTGKVTVLKYVAAVDCGTAINPRLAEGQTEGAVLNGISFALTEEYLFDNRGRMLNPNFNYYKIFSTRDLPEIKTILVPTYEPTGPYGAKSVSEISINGPIPAISNAIYDAVGIRLRRTPFTPDRVLETLGDHRP